MNGVLSAESAVLLHFETIGVILLVFHGVVVSLLALGASQSDFNAHKRHLLKLPPCITPAMKNLVSGQLHSHSEAEKGAQKNSPFSQVDTFYHRGYKKVNIFLPYFFNILLYFLLFLQYNRNVGGYASLVMWEVCQAVGDGFPVPYGLEWQ